MKVAIIILGNQWVCPYVNTYKSVFDRLGCSYDVILWDRDGSDSTAAMGYSSAGANLCNPFVKAWHYLRYSRFIKKMVLENGYDRLVVSGPHLAILLACLLRKRFKGRYIIDYRDISVEQKPLLKSVYSKVVADSFCNVISSPGFKACLPAGHEYLISHNFSVDAAIEALENNPVQKSVAVPLDILTIGYIRNFSSNVKLIESLGGSGDYRLRFAGRGDAAAALHDFAASKNYTNVEFSGFYKKEDEAAIVAKCDFINIFFPSDMEHSAIMSNRFYLALIHKKPVIVTAGSVQEVLVRKYGLGIVTADCRDIDVQIKDYFSTFDYAQFCNRCNELLAVFVEEHKALERAMAAFVKL
ncbi:MAG: hypothetical protein IKU76_03315 [Bacteroidaceae bacterium]|nr:hypothetical protein [Bacteroidaceae bacterium]